MSSNDQIRREQGPLAPLVFQQLKIFPLEPANKAPAVQHSDVEDD
jgi:hypothetical protein